MRGCASSPSVSSPAGCACDSYPCTSAQPDPSAQGEIGGASICEHYRASPAIPGGPARVLQAPEFVWSSGSGSFPGARAARHLAVFRWRKRPPAPPAGPATAAFAWFALTSHQKRSQKRSASRRRCRERKQWKILFCNWPQVVSVVGFVVLNVHRFVARSLCYYYMYSVAPRQITVKAARQHHPVRSTCAAAPWPNVRSCLARRHSAPTRCAGPEEHLKVRLTNSNNGYAYGKGTERWESCKL